MIVILLSLELVLSKKNKKSNNIIVNTMCIALYVIYVFRDFSVGIDMPGYEQIYNIYTDIDFSVFDEIYMEDGYIFLMQIFNKLGFSFRGFIACFYLILLLPLRSFILRYSNDVFMSFLIFVCFQFFVFSLSGLRQTIAMGICLWAFLIAQKKGLFPFVFYSILILIALSIHRSAFIFFPAYFVIRFPLDIRLILVFVIATIVAFIIRLPLYFYLKGLEITEYNMSEEVSFGAAFFFLLITTIISLLVKDNKEYNDDFNAKLYKDNKHICFTFSSQINVLICCLILFVVFNGSILLRIAIYYEMIFLLTLPCLLAHLPNSLRIPTKIGLSI